MARSSQPAFPDFEHSLPMMLLRAREAVMGRFRPMLRKFDLTEQQWRIIRALSEVEERDASDRREKTCHGLGHSCEHTRDVLLSSTT